MPYNLPKDIGGDSPENVKWMEGCVSKVTKGGKAKPSAIAICKAQLIKNKRNSTSEEEFNIDKEILGKQEVFEIQYVSKKMDEGMTYAQARADLEVYLAKRNWTV